VPPRDLVPRAIDAGSGAPAIAYPWSQLSGRLLDDPEPPSKGETIAIEIPTEDTHVFSTGTGRRMSGDITSVARLSQANLSRQAAQPH
jgi:hypothetical protein